MRAGRVSGQHHACTELYGEAVALLAHPACTEGLWLGSRAPTKRADAAALEIPGISPCTVLQNSQTHGIQRTL